jgi:predicted metal-binding membrane protein
VIASASSGPAPALTASRARAGLVAVLFALAGVGWWWLVHQMSGMDNGPWTGLGSFGWFVGVWVVMMAAMMLPSIAPTVALYARMTRMRSARSPLAFAAGYLITWAIAGVSAFALAFAGRHIGGDVLAWDRAGRWVAGATLVAAGAYELTPLGFLLGSWREGWFGALQMGIKSGAWCVGCCWALMASLFALGIMSVTWMAIAGGLIAIEKLLPWRRLATYGVAAILLALGVLMLVDPSSIPALTIPSHSGMGQMTAMHP